MRVLLLSAYAAGSHRYWRRGLQAMLPDWQWRVEELPPRHFSWRIRGNALHWQSTLKDVAAADFDLLLATSMVDLATLRGLLPELARLPTALYFHENQFDYPQGRSRHGLLEAQMVTLYSALSAERLLFNSAYNRDSFLAGVRALLQGMPDLVPPGLEEALRRRSAVLPVPLGPLAEHGGRRLWSQREGASPLRLLWCGRLEHDKGGEQLLAAIELLDQSGLDFELAVTGQEFRSVPPAFTQMRDRFQHRLVHFGYLTEEADYHRLLSDADLVFSTAIHEFQGLAVMEAVALGCVPLCPQRQAYPEYLDQQFLYPSLPDDPNAEAGGAVQRLISLADQLAQGEVAAPEMSRISRAHLAAEYRRALTALAAGEDSQ